MMLRRILIPLFLFVLIFAQAVSGVCRVRCDQVISASAASSCHSMAMPDDAPKIYAAAPCSSHSCTVGDILLSSRSTFSENACVGFDSPAMVAGAAPILKFSRLSSVLARPAPTPPVPPASLLKTSLRV